MEKNYQSKRKFSQQEKKTKIHLNLFLFFFLQTDLIFLKMFFKELTDNVKFCKRSLCKDSKIYFKMGSRSGHAYLLKKKISNVI